MMIWALQMKTGATETDLATGTYADGLFPLTLKYPENREERSFRGSYGQDTQFARKGPPLAATAAC